MASLEGGVLRTDGPVYLYGTFKGQLETASGLFVGPLAQVTADVEAESVSVAGIVRGNITASGQVEILAGGRVYGDIVASALRIDEGAVFSGMSTLRPEEVNNRPNWEGSNIT
jgi:cytoskeletal protein CcmA (bactofilin family)